MIPRVVVPVKRVIDFAVKVRVRADGSGVETANVKHSMNPFDEIAVTEAVKLKERKFASEVVAVSVGTKKCHEVLRTALAMGADRAMHIDVPDDRERALEPLQVARLLRAALQQRIEGARLVVLGKQAIDDDAGEVPQLLAGLLGWAQGTFASVLETADGSVRVTREVDGGLSTLVLRLPAVISCDLRLNTPRRCALPAILAANKKPLQTVPASELGGLGEPRVRTVRVREPPIRPPGTKVASVDELVARLRTAGFVA